MRTEDSANLPYSRPMPRSPSRADLFWFCTLLLALWCVGMFGRGIWTPDEPRETDIAWRMSWQSDKAVPLLAGEAFCEKPPLTYWMAALPIRLFGQHAWSTRAPNLLYAILTALCVGLLSTRSAGRTAGIIAAGLISTFLLSYQVEIWFATDAPVLAAVSCALLGLHEGFYARSRLQRLGGYSLMHVALGLGFLSKSAAGWMAPTLSLLTLIAWERRWRELLRWELYIGLVFQGAMILTWMSFVYAGPDGPAHLKVFFWNNLVGRFTRVDAPAELQYAAAHRNSPGKYLVELPLYLFPWTLAVLAAARQAWRRHAFQPSDYRTVRFALAASLPTLLLLSFAATARNVYAAPALPGLAVLVAWWGTNILRRADTWDLRALRGTALILLLAAAVMSAAALLIAFDAGPRLASPMMYTFIECVGVLAAAVLSLRAWHAAARDVAMAQCALFAGYGILLVGPLAVIYPQVDRWQDLESIAREVRADTLGKTLILLAPDETTRAIIDLYADSSVLVASGSSAQAALERAHSLAANSNSAILVQEPGRSPPRSAWLGAHLLGRNVVQPPQPPWARFTAFSVVKEYALPNGRRYALLQSTP